MRRFAVIDMGTNTFHLLIAGWRGKDEYVPIYRDRIYVKLGEDGLDVLTSQKMKQAVDAMERFHRVIQLFEVHEVRAIATEGLRRAANGDILLQRIDRGLGIQAEVISGEQEASYIYQGVMTAGLLDHEKAMIMDIGGGSVEFIIATHEHIFDLVSLPIGLATLTPFVEPDHVLDQHWLAELHAHIDTGLASLPSMHGIGDITTLIGSSGTFDVIGDATGTELPDGTGQLVALEDWHAMAHRLSAIPKAHRADAPDIPPHRADLIVHAIQLIDRVIHKLPSIENMKVSPYALKEGVLSEMMKHYGESLRQS